MLLSNKYDLLSLDAVLDKDSHNNRQVILNDASGMLLTRHLTFVSPDILEQQYPDLAFDQLKLHVDNSGGYADHIQTRRKKVQGAFAERGSGRGKVALEMEDNLIKVFERDALLEWDDIKVKKAQEQKINLVSDTMAASILIFNQEIDTSAIVGIEGFNSTGLVNNTVYLSESAPAIFTSLTAIQQYKLIADAITQQWNLVNNTAAYKANICLLPTTILNLASNSKLNEFTDGTVLAVLKKNFPDINFLHSAKASAVAGGSMSIFSNNRQALAFRIPLPLMYSPIFRKHFDYSTSALYRIAGIDILEPSSGYIKTNLLVAV